MCVLLSIGLQFFSRRTIVSNTRCVRAKIHVPRMMYCIKTTLRKSFDCISNIMSRRIGCKPLLTLEKISKPKTVCTLEKSFDPSLYTANIYPIYPMDSYMC